MIKFHAVAQDAAGNALPAATFQWKNHLTGSDAPIYADNETTPLTNPVTGDSYGRASWKTPAGLYDLVISKDGYTVTLAEITIVEDEGVLYLVNANGSAIAAGEMVYIFGDGTVKRGQNDGTATEASVIAACLEGTLANAGTGRFRALGLIDRTGTPGAVGYLDDDGTITEVAPTTGYLVAVGRQVSASKFYLDTELPILVAP